MNIPASVVIEAAVGGLLFGGLAAAAIYPDKLVSLAQAIRTAAAFAVAVVTWPARLGGTWRRDLRAARAYSPRHSLDTDDLDDPWFFEAPADTWLSRREVAA